MDRHGIAAVCVCRVCPSGWQVGRGEEEPLVRRLEMDGTQELLRNATPLASGKIWSWDGRRLFLAGENAIKTL